MKDQCVNIIKHVNYWWANKRRKRYTDLTINKYSIFEAFLDT